MRIERGKKKTTSYHVGSPTGMKEIKRGSPSSFEQELAGQKAAEIKQRMQEILRDVDMLAERLKKSLTVNDLMRYKQLVKEFLKEASARAYLLKQERGASRRGRTILVTIDVIDKDMQTLVEEFMQKKTDPVEVLAVMDKIRGMLIDLMV